jgi:glycosyltransferase involved in cell wall biosynthesis
MNVLEMFEGWLKQRQLVSQSKGISILIPFRGSDPNSQRTKNFEWLSEYWAKQLPGAEIIEGYDAELDQPFSKAAAVNNAVSWAKGDILAVIDADGYVSPDVILKCATEIRRARARGQKLWFVPYRKFYRLTKEASSLLLASDPANPIKFTCPPRPEHMQGDTDPNVGHWYGAMVQIMPKEAFDAVGGWDPRFRGWGGEDHAAMRAMDTLYWPHKTMPTQVLHVWHPQLGPKGVDKWVHWKERMWDGQTDPSVNDRLSWRYYHASGNPKIMRKLLDEGLQMAPARHKQKKHKHQRKHHHHHRKSV